MNVCIKKTTALIMSVIIAVCASGCGKSQDDSSKAKIDDVPTVSARITVDGTKFKVDGKDLWINGVNTPWNNWNDFTGSMDYDFWDKTFEQLAADGVNCTRIWVNCAGESIIRLKSTGEIKTIKEEHWSDLDKLFEIAEKHKVYVMATLTSFDHCKGETGSPERWRALMKSKTSVDDFADKYVKKFCERYKDCEYLFSIDIMNEPDWVYENEECGQIPWENLSYFFGKCAATIHENSDILVTVGMGIIKYNSDKYEGNKISDEYLKELTGNDNAYVDFYSTHYYMWMKSSFGYPFDGTPEAFGLEANKPCLVGETSNDDGDQCGYSPSEKYQAAYDNNWQGVMVWMQTQEDKSWYRYDLTQESTKYFAEKYPQLVHPIEG